MTEEMRTLYMYHVKGTDSTGDPVEALVIAKDDPTARQKVREEYQGTIVGLQAERITGAQWETYLRDYGSAYGPFGAHHPETLKDFGPRAHNYALSSGRPIFL